MSASRYFAIVVGAVSDSVGVEVCLDSLGECLTIGGDLWRVLVDGHTGGTEDMNVSLRLVGRDGFMAVLADGLLNPFSIFVPLDIERTGIFLCRNAGDQNLIRR